MLRAVTGQLENERAALGLEDERAALDAADDSRGREAGRRVVFVVTQSGNRANGGVESITQVLERLRRVNPIVVTQMETPSTRRWQDAGLKVLVWPMTAPRPWSLARTNLKMFRLLRSTAARVVHCNDIMALWQTSFGARLAGAAVVFNVRNIKREGERYGWRWRVARRVSNRQLVLSREMREALATRLAGQHSSVARSIEYIYSAVDPGSFSPVGAGERAALRERFGIGEECFAIGFVAAFEPRKAQLDFITEAVPRLQKLLPQARVFFVGDFAPEVNDYARQCLEAVKDLGLGEMVSFVGYQPAVGEWYRALDVVMVASRNEGLARCMIESLACGTPVVSFDVCSAREILEGGGCGVVVSRGDYESLAQQVAALAGRRDAREQFGRRGAALAREIFDPRQVVSRYEQLYSSLDKK